MTTTPTVSTIVVNLAYGATFSAVILGAMEILARGVNWCVDRALRTSPPLPHNPKHHLDVLDFRDRLYIGINKLLTVLFVAHLLYAVWRLPSVAWALESLGLANTLGSLTAFFVLYDLFYATFHRILHARALYKLVHKHHHRQISPTRGNYDAINVLRKNYQRGVFAVGHFPSVTSKGARTNRSCVSVHQVHPFEFFVGEYLHLLVVALVPCHVVAVLAFVLLGGVLASLNHTRLGFAVPGFYDVRHHDVHHRWPDNNFGQYIMLWDKLFGWFRQYDPPKVA